MAKLTLAEKKLINEHVTGETKRCLAILMREIKDWEKNATDPGDEHIIDSFKTLAKEIIEDSPFIKFHPELLKRIPK